MTVKSYRFSSGRLILGTGPLAVSGQMTNIQVQAAESTTIDPPIPVVTGEKIAQELVDVILTWTLSGKLLQDLTAAGIIDWSWDHDGLTEEPFVFVPDLPSARAVEGICYPIPITLGGDAKTRPQSDFTWRAKGGDDHPIFGVWDPIDDTVTEDV